MTCWFAFASTLYEGRPKYELEESIIGHNPGLGFRPMPPESNVESTLIWYEKNNPNNSKYWVEEIGSFLEGKLPSFFEIKFFLQNAFVNDLITGFQTEKPTENMVDCKKVKPDDGKTCKVDVSGFGACTEKNGFGYPEGKPCIFLKLNKIFNWVPEYYKKGENLPDKMPKSLKNHIEKRQGEALEVVWVSCEGENPADIENLGEGTSYKSLSGEQGFLGRYFPFKNTEGYLQPIVAVQFTTITRKCCCKFIELRIMSIRSFSRRFG